MKIYLVLSDKLITGYSFDKLVGTEEVDIKDLSELKVGIDTFEDGKIISNEAPEGYYDREELE